MNNKGRAGDQIMIITFFLMLLMIALGIISMVVIFMGNEYDTRDVDALQLNDAVRSCVGEYGNNLSSDNFFDMCKINESVIINRDMKLKVCIDSKDCVTEQNPFVVAGENFQACDFVGVKDNQAFARCYKNNATVGGKKYQIISGSVQWVRRQVL